MNYCTIVSIYLYRYYLISYDRLHYYSIYHKYIERILIDRALKKISNIVMHQTGNNNQL